MSDNDPFAAMRETQERIDNYYRMSPEDFDKLPVKVQNRVLFEMMREMTGEVRDVARMARVMEESTQKFIDLADKFSTPEGMQEIMGAVTKAIMGGDGKGLLGGLF